MFRLSSNQIAGHRILVLEENSDECAMLVAQAEAAGALFAASTGTIEEARHLAMLYDVSRIVLHTRYAAVASSSWGMFVRPKAELVYVTGYDDWYGSDEEEEDSLLAYG
jgi:hypothetical protein